MKIVEKSPSELKYPASREQFERDGSAAPLLEARTQDVDAIIQSNYERYLKHALPGPVALLAVGGYGRRQLFPQSDVDLLLLVEKGPQATGQREGLSEFLRELWDSGLRLGHSVRTPQECAEIHAGNVELSISLLDRRLLAGDADFYQSFNQTQDRFFSARRHDLRRALGQMLRTRHVKAQQTVYQLEPNLKESPGGLRDLQTVVWLDQLADPSADRIPFLQEFPELTAARDFFWSTRVVLHLETGRDANQIGFEIQEKLAEQPWFGASDAAAWMRQYFHHARTTARLALRSVERVEERASGLFSAFREWRSRLSTPDFSVSHDRLLLKVPHRLPEDPDLIFRLFEFVGRHKVRLAWETERRIQTNLPAILALHHGEPVWERFSAILRLPRADLALRAMHETGFLGALAPPWEGIQSLVIRDFQHRYTVDEHTLVTIETLCRLVEKPSDDQRRMAGLMSEVEQPELLLLALLLHDVGKADPDGSHSERSVELAEGVMERLGTPDDDRAVVRFLIGEHLLLSKVMSTRDPEDPKTGEYIGRRVGSLERLRLLTLLTYADISSVFPGAMTAWRRDQLWRVYLAGHRELTRELESDRIHEAPVSPEQAQFLEGFPTRYLITHSLEQIARHFELELQRRVEGVGVSLDRRGGYWEAVLVTEDRPQFFATIAGLLSGFGLNILKAEAFSNAQGVILDTFVFSDPHHNLDLNPSEVEHLRIRLRRAALGRIDVAELLRTRPAPKAPTTRATVTPAVRFDSTVSDRSTLVEVVAQDRPGLLFDLARTFSDSSCDIEVVLIETQAHRAMDVFYVSASGQKLSKEAETSLRAVLLETC